jgi:hypothetical protein
MKLIILSLILFFSFSSFEQEIYIKVKKGSAFLDNEKLSSEKGVRKLSAKSKLTIDNNSLVLIRQNKKLLQLKSVKSYKTNQIEQLLEKKKEMESSNYINVLFYESMQKPAPIQSGSVTRGNGNVNWSELAFTPNFNAFLLSDTFRIKVLNSGVLIGEVLELRSPQWNDSKFYKLQKDDFFILDGLNPGSYEWIINLTAIDSTAEDKFFKLSLGFQIPNEAQLSKIIYEENEFKKSIYEFDADIKLELLKEFYLDKKWIR